jgi:muramoyltetrapeptide carboxypeptidase
VFAEMAAMAVGKPYLYDGHIGLPSFDEIVSAEAGAMTAPILAGIDCGHTLPMLTLPIGIPAEVDADERTFHLLEPAVE